VVTFLGFFLTFGCGAVKLSRDTNKVFVAAEAPFSKRYLKVCPQLEITAVLVHDGRALCHST